MLRQGSNGLRLRSLIVDGTIVAPGVFNPIAAMLVQRAGFPALYVSGAGLSNSLALRDEGNLSRNKVLSMTKDILNVIGIPAIADVDTGFGGPGAVAKTVELFEEAGVAAVQMEDQMQRFKRCGHLPGKRVISLPHMVEKIRAAVAAKRNADFVIIARTDARAIEGLDAAIARANAYAEAGADIIFPEALESKEEFLAMRKAVRIPLLANMTEDGKTPYLSSYEFASMGYDIVIFPQTAFRGMMQAGFEVLQELRVSGTQKSLRERGRLMPRAKVDEFLRDYANKS